MVPGTIGAPPRWAASRLETLSPISVMADGGGPMNATPMSVIARGEVGVLGEEAVTGVDAVGATVTDRAEDGVGVEIALGRGLPAERVRLVGEPDVQRVPIELGVDRDGLDAELASGADRRARRSRRGWRSGSSAARLTMYVPWLFPTARRPATSRPDGPPDGPSAMYR